MLVATLHAYLMPFGRCTLYGVFFASGAAALIFQVAWQRVLSLHAGMDLFAATTVVAAFMAGLGMGNLLGGSIADRLTPKGAVLMYASAELLIGSFGWLSIWLLYKQYATFSPYLHGNASAFLFHFVLLSIPTTLMGATLPLLSRGVVRRSSEIAPMVGKLYGANTLGAAVGAMATAGWWILGRVGLEGVIQIAACLNLGSGLLALSIFRTTDIAAQPAESSGPTTPQATSLSRPSHWIILYGFTGFVSLALEVVWFRLLNVLMYSTTYTFSRLLAVYLIFFGFGVLAGSYLSPKVRRPERLFLWLQFAIGLAALVGPLLVVKYAEGVGQAYWSHFRNLVAPLLVLSIPTFLMGLCFPLMERLVAENVGTLGKRTGALLFSNTAGAVLGTVITGFMLLEFFGTPKTLLVLSLSLMLLGFYAASLLDRGRRRLVAAVFVLSVTAVLSMALPTKGGSFWAPLHGADPNRLTIVEDGTCVAGLVEGEPTTLLVSGEPQNSIPFSDFHIRLGAVPALLHSNPQDVLVIGLGVGSTLYGISLDRRASSIKCVEICAGEIPLLKGLRGNVPELDQIFSDPRIRLTVQDGRKFLLDTRSRFDLIASDTLLARSSYSGSLYSVEFYELVRRRLKPGGIFAQWVASERTLQTASYAFPHVFVLRGPEIRRDILVASDSPVEVDPKILAKRFAQIKRQQLRPDAERRLAAYLRTAFGDNNFRNSPITLEQVNRDLFPRDEYGRW